MPLVKDGRCGKTSQKGILPRSSGNFEVYLQALQVIRALEGVEVLNFRKFELVYDFLLDGSS